MFPEVQRVTMPYFIILIFALIGLIKHGLWGFILGIIWGCIFNFSFGLISIILSKFCDLSIIKREIRIKIAKDFFDQNKEQIIKIKRFEQMSDIKIVTFLSRCINDIHTEASKLRHPFRKSNFDFDYASYKPNFIDGGKKWLTKFTDVDETSIMDEYLSFLVDAIYESHEKYR